MDTLNPEYLFRQTAAQMRRNGGRGGRATARNRRLRPPVPVSQLPQPDLPPQPTTAAAIAALDAQFPWLCGCERPPRERSRN